MAAPEFNSIDQGRGRHRLDHSFDTSEIDDQATAEIGALKVREAAVRQLGVTLLGLPETTAVDSASPELQRATRTAEHLVSDTARNFRDDTAIELTSNGQVKIAEALGRTIRRQQAEYATHPLNVDQLLDRLREVIAIIGEAQKALRASPPPAQADRLKHQKALLVNLIERQALEYVYQAELAAYAHTIDQTDLQPALEEEEGGRAVPEEDFGEGFATVSEALQGARDLLTQQRITPDQAKKLLDSDDLTIPHGTSREAMIQALREIIAADVALEEVMTTVVQTATAKMSAEAAPATVEEPATQMLPTAASTPLRQHPRRESIVISRSTSDAERAAAERRQQRINTLARQLLATGQMPRLEMPGSKEARKRFFDEIRETAERLRQTEGVPEVAATTGVDAEASVTTVMPEASTPITVTEGTMAASVDHEVTLSLDVQRVLGNVAHQFNDTILSDHERSTLIPIIRDILDRYRDDPEAVVHVEAARQQLLLDNRESLKIQDANQRDNQLQFLAQQQAFEYLSHSLHDTYTRTAESSKEEFRRAALEAKTKIQSYDDAIVIFNELQDNTNDNSLMNEIRDEVVRLIPQRLSEVINSTELLPAIEQDIQNIVQAIMTEYYQSFMRQQNRGQVDPVERTQMFQTLVEQYERRRQPTSVETIDATLHNLILTVTARVITYRTHKGFEQIEVPVEALESNEVPSESVSGEAVPNELVSEEIDRDAAEEPSAITLDELAIPTADSNTPPSSPEVPTVEIFPQSALGPALVDSRHRHEIPVVVDSQNRMRHLATEREQLHQAADERRQRAVMERARQGLDQIQFGPPVLTAADITRLGTERTHLIEQEQRLNADIASLQGGTMSHLSLIGGLIRRAGRWANAERITRHEANLRRLRERLMTVNRLLASAESAPTIAAAPASAPELVVPSAITVPTPESTAPVTPTRVVEPATTAIPETNRYRRYLIDRNAEQLSRLQNALMQRRTELRRTQPTTPELQQIQNRLDLIYERFDQLNVQEAAQANPEYVTYLQRLTTRDQIVRLQQGLEQQQRTVQQAERPSAWQRLRGITPPVSPRLINIDQRLTLVKDRLAQIERPNA